MVAFEATTSAADTTTGNGTLDERVYYCQNWRHDVVALLTDTGAMIERIVYSAYGVPSGIPAQDLDQDGEVDTADENAISILISAGGYDVEADHDHDGDVDAADLSAAQGSTATLGWAVLSDVGNIIGYAGYVHDPGLVDAKWHVRHRVLDRGLGRWLTRDPAGYVDGVNLYQYAVSAPISYVDPYGDAVELPSLPNDPYSPDNYSPLYPSQEISCAKWIERQLPQTTPIECLEELRWAYIKCCHKHRAGAKNWRQRENRQKSLVCAKQKRSELMPECVQDIPLPPTYNPSRPGLLEC